MRLRFNIFNLRTPRTFHHEFIYVDERKERLQQIEERARRELAGASPCENASERLRGQFMKTVQERRRRRQGNRQYLLLLAVAFFLLVLVVLLFMSVVAAG